MDAAKKKYIFIIIVMLTIFSIPAYTYIYEPFAEKQILKRHYTVLSYYLDCADGGKMPKNMNFDMNNKSEMVRLNSHGYSVLIDKIKEMQKAYEITKIKIKNDNNKLILEELIKTTTMFEEYTMLKQKEYSRDEVAMKVGKDSFSLEEYYERDKRKKLFDDVFNVQTQKLDYYLK